MTPEQLKQLEERLAQGFDTIMEEKLKIVVSPIVVSETKKIVEEMRLERALYGHDRTGLSEEQKKQFAETVQKIAFGKAKANEALISGYGSTSDGVAMAHPTKEVQDHGRMVAHGIEAVWGVKAIPRTDGLVNGYVGIISGFKIAGMPDIS